MLYRHLTRWQLWYIFCPNINARFKHIYIIHVYVFNMHTGKYGAHPSEMAHKNFDSAPSAHKPKILELFLLMVNYATFRLGRSHCWSLIKQYYVVLQYSCMQKSQISYCQTPMRQTSCRTPVPTLLSFARWPIAYRQRQTDHLPALTRTTFQSLCR